DLIQNGHDSAQQMPAAQAQRAGDGLRQHCDRHTDEQHDGRESDQHIQRLEHGFRRAAMNRPGEASTPIIKTRVKTLRRLACYDAGIMMTRRTAVGTLGVSALAASAQVTAPLKGRLKQSVSRWCYEKYSLDDLCKAAVRIGLKGIDLIDSKDWPAVQKYGLVPSMTPGAGTIPDALNRKENHARLESEFRKNIEKAAKAGVPNVITFSGNRRGLPDNEGIENCVIGLNRVKKIAEDNNVMICLELLNSKVDHKDYQCDHTAWGVEVIKRV